MPNRINDKAVETAFTNAMRSRRGDNTPYETRKTETATGASRANRFEQLKDANSAEAVENLYKMIRDDAFGPTASAAFGPAALTGERLARANDIMYSVMSELGMAGQLEKLSATTLQNLGLDLDQLGLRDTVSKVRSMATWGSDAQKLAEAEGMSINTVTWQDTSRTVGSSWGDNITDMTISQELRDARTGKSETAEMPVIQLSNNMTDKTADIDLDKFMVTVGNATGGEPKNVSLRQILDKPWEYLSDSKNWPLKGDDGKAKGLFAPGTDESVLVSAQAGFLPITKQGGKATYTPTVYNYQSHNDEKKGAQPAVLTLMVTREGVTIDVMGKRKAGRNGEDGAYGERLFFNKAGQRAQLTAERASTSSVKGSTSSQGGDVASGADQLNRVLVIQVPLIPEVPRPAPKWGGGLMLESAAVTRSFSPRGRSDIEDAVISAGPVEGPMDENLGTGWKRDGAKPIRVTVQLMKATSNGVATADDMKSIKKELEAVYKDASRVGSLVLPDGLPKQPTTPPGPIFLETTPVAATKS